MYVDEGEQYLRRAAQPTLEVFDFLAKRVPEAIKPVLEEIRKRLFDPGYTVAELKETLGLSSNRFIAAFRGAVGLTPWDFIRDCRLETAARLLRDSDLFVVDVTLLVGYDSEASFSRLFAQWSGLRPKAYRARARALTARLGAPPEQIFSWERCERLCNAELGAEEADEMIAAIETIPLAA